jgi:hypothetical protein
MNADAPNADAIFGETCPVAARTSARSENGSASDKTFMSSSVLDNQTAHSQPDQLTIVF